MERLNEFLNHSLLPFTGRQAEVERIVAFWRGTFDAHELRASLLIGEAGIGKSRLVQETIPHVAQAGGTVIHARLFPESGASIVPLMAQALLYSDTARRLLRAEPERTLASVVASLRRLARLRPTLLVIDDIHLLSGDAVRELTSLLDALTEESLALLCTARPVELPARAPLERFLVEERTIAGLAPEAVKELWSMIFDGAAETELIAHLSATTVGNPLAIRSALRAAIRMRAIVPDAERMTWRRSLDIDDLAKLFRESVDLLAEGMVAHLSDEERRLACALASLGEVFGGETARLLAPVADALLPSLLFKGIIVRPGAVPPPLPGRPASATPLAFTHSLLHQHLATVEDAPITGLPAVIRSSAPLYSIAPFRIIAEGRLSDAVAADDLTGALERTIALTRALDIGADWQLARDVIAAGWNMLAALRNRIPPRAHHLLHLSLLARTLCWFRRDIRGPEFAARLRELLDLTADAADADAASHRLKALHYLHLRRSETDAEHGVEVWEEIESLVERNEPLSRDPIYLDYLDEVARIAASVADVTMLRRVEQRVERLLADPRSTGELRDLARARVAPKFLLLFDTPEELGRRMALLAGLPSEFDGANASNVMYRIALLETTGHMVEALAETRAAIGRLRAIGLQRNAATCALISLSARAALGLELGEIEEELAALLAMNGITASASFRRSACIYLTEIGLLRGELAWTRRIQNELQPGKPLFWPEGELMLGIAEGAIAEAAIHLDRDEETGNLLAILAGTLTETATVAEGEAAALRLLERPLLKLDDLLPLHATLAMIATAKRGTFSAALRQSARHALTGALEWSVERHLLPLTASLLERHAGFLAQRERQHRLEQLRTLEEERESARLRTRLQIRAFGTFSFGSGSGEQMPLRGARLRTLLALLIATRVMREPLTHREFCRLAAGGETDPDLARKTTNMAVARLREVIGNDAIITGEETYALSLDHVDVDLFDAYRLLDEARSALRRRALAAAMRSLLRVLDIVRGEVPFPGLYDDFFEALRNDFEFRFRSAVVDIARALIWESDLQDAIDLLRRAFEGIPDDEEIGELLTKALTAAGQHADAERIRMMVATDTEP